MSADSAHRFQVRCDSGMHRVALDPARYWRPAKCPSCRTRMDRRRFRRLQHWLLGNAPRSALRVNDGIRIVPVQGLALLFVALMLGVTLALHTVADAWWPATMLLFLGRWPWLLPGLAVLLLALFLEHRRAVVTTLGGGVIALFGVLDFTLGLGRLATKAEGAAQIRVITYNIGGSAVAPMALVAMATDWQPDIIAIQECSDASVALLRGMPNVYSDIGTTCLFTKFPILRVDSLRREAVRDAQGAAWVKRYRLRSVDGDFDFTNVRLDTPRNAFEPMMDGREAATTTIAEKTKIRDLESKLARRWVDLGPGPRLVAGDFNMPSESAIYRRHWKDLTNGFSYAGRGFGYSLSAGWIQLRIDHVLADERWIIQSAKLLPDYGSDHLPMMTDVALRTK